MALLAVAPNQNCEAAALLLRISLKEGINSSFSSHQDSLHPYGDKNLEKAWWTAYKRINKIFMFYILHEKYDNF